MRYILSVFVFAVCAVFAISGRAATADTLDYTKCVVTYNYRCHTVNQENDSCDVNYRIILQVGNEVSCSMGYFAHEEDNGMELFKEKQHFIPVCYQNYPHKTLTALETVPYDHFQTQEKLPNIQWELCPQTDTICGYICQKAKGNYFSREWTVWFAKEIPSQAGPWRLQGLPGLILKAECDHIHSFECGELSFVKEPIIFHPVDLPVKSTHKKFVKFRNKKMSSDDVNNISPSVTSGIIVFKDEGVIMLNGVSSKDNSVVYQPLELK